MGIDLSTVHPLDAIAFSTRYSTGPGYRKFRSATLFLRGGRRYEVREDDVESIRTWIRGGMRG